MGVGGTVPATGRAGAAGECGVFEVTCVIGSLMPGVTPRLTGHNARNAPGILGSVPGILGSVPGILGRCWAGHTR